MCVRVRLCVRAAVLLCYYCMLEIIVLCQQIAYIHFICCPMPCGKTVAIYFVCMQMHIKFIKTISTLSKHFHFAFYILHFAFIHSYTQRERARYKRRRNDCDTDTVYLFMHSALRSIVSAQCSLEIIACMFHYDDYYYYMRQGASFRSECDMDSRFVWLYLCITPW